MVPVGGRRFCGGSEMVCRVRRAAVPCGQGARVCGAGNLAGEELINHEGGVLALPSCERRH